MSKEVIWSIGFFFLLNAVCLADTVYLKDGKKIQGQIVEQTEEAVKINVKGVTLTYFSDEVERVDSSAAGQSASVSSHAVQPLPARTKGSGAIDSVLSSSPMTTTKPPMYSVTTDDSFSSMDKKGLTLNLIEVSGAKENMNQMFSQIMNQASPEDAQKLREILSVGEVIDQLVPVYDKYFTEEELKGLISFYKSSLGRKLLMVTPLIMQDSMNEILFYFQKKTQSLQGQASTPSQGQK